MAGQTISWKYTSFSAATMEAVTARVEWWCQSANSTSATVKLTLTCVPYMSPGGGTMVGTASASLIFKDVTSNSQVTLSASVDNETMTATQTETFTCTTKTDNFLLSSISVGGDNPSNVTKSGQIYWTSGSGGGGGGSSTGSITLYLGASQYVFPNTSNPPWPTSDNTQNGTTWGYLSGSNGTVTNANGIYDMKQYNNQTGTNTFLITGNTVKYNNVTWTATPRNTTTHRFVGWNQAQGQNIQLSSLAVSNKVYVQAYFEEIPTYTVSYNANGGSGAPSAQTKREGVDLTLSSTKPTRKGYVFVGWAKSSTAKLAQIQPGATYTSDSSITLYAVWWKCAYIYNGSTWKAAVPYIYKNSTDGWVRAMPYVYDSGWK